jgi:hypothetical protein
VGWGISVEGFGEAEFLAISESVFLEIAWLVGPNGGFHRSGYKFTRPWSKIAVLLKINLCSSEHSYI